MATGDKLQVVLANKNTLQFSDARNYFTGAVVVKDKVIYECLEDITAGDWDETKWQSLGLVYWEEKDEALVPTETNINTIGDATKTVKTVFTYSVNGGGTVLATDQDGNFIDDGAGGNVVEQGNNLTISHTSGGKDMQFLPMSIDVNKHTRYMKNTGISFLDGDSEGDEEGVYMRMDVNDLAFYGILNGNYNATETLRIGYGGNVIVKRGNFIVDVDGGRVRHTNSEDKHIEMYQATGKEGDGYIVTNNPNIHFGTNGSTSHMYLSGGGSLRPSSDTNGNLGSGSNRWNVIYGSQIRSSEVRAEGGDHLLLNSPDGDVVFQSKAGDAKTVYIDSNGHLKCENSGQDLGASSFRWDRLYCKNNNDVSSDRRLKKDIQDIPVELLEVWFDYVKPKSFIVKDNKTEERSSGVIAQDIIAAFEAAGLDWKEWSIISEGDERHPFYGVIYDHVQIIEMAAIRHKLGL